MNLTQLRQARANFLCANCRNPNRIHLAKDLCTNCYSQAYKKARKESNGTTK